MKAPFSAYLTGIEPGLRRLVELLGSHYDYVSILATDSVGFSMGIGQRAKAVKNETMTTERGQVVRVHRNGLYSEYAFNAFEPEKSEEKAAEILKALDAQLMVLKATGSQVYDTAALPDEPCELTAEFDCEILPENCDQKQLIERLTALSNAGMARGKDMLDCRVSFQSTHISKLFLTANRHMRQSYVYSEGAILPIAMREGKNALSYESASGRKGIELLDELEGKLDSALTAVEDCLRADHIEPGEYDIITSPEVSGLIAHEAFGHGVEMDMFVKGRALGADYIGKRVGSDLVTMHEGATCAVDVTSYAFDDEGTLAGDVIEIENGILRTGICDALSALRLGTAATGNGKRENYAHKVYTRMTNTIFDSGHATLEEMIASVQHGYLLRGMQSGMEDPKHWGIQCIIERGYEIVDGKLTGKVVSPIVMTGYVPDLLGSVSMASGDREVFGSGGCGKGYKEWVKVSDGGPYLKARAHLG
ncbi:MAG: TldD/PmbA family protein [Clostridia bacterium]|nr:TldD/PmbA family protein [Clostridia bacterium]